MRLVRLPRKTHLRLFGTLIGFVALAISGAMLAKGVGMSVRNGAKPPPSATGRAPASEYVSLENYIEPRELEKDDEDRADADQPPLRTHLGNKLASAPKAMHGGLVFTAAPNSTLDVNEVYRRAGVMGQRRARRVIFHEAAFLASLQGSANAQERTVDLPLFDDYKPRVKLLPASPFSANDGIHTGQLVHDPSSQVHLFVANGQISGEIEATGHKFRLVNVGGSETFIIEEE